MHLPALAISRSRVRTVRYLQLGTSKNVYIQVEQLLVLV
jgi:hypothetical protein